MNPFRPSLTAAAASEALMIHAMQKPEELLAKRELFEAGAYAHYLERWDGAKAGTYVGEPMSQEKFCARNPEKPDSYFYSDLNNAWWGFQAGFMAAALRGGKDK